MYNEQFNLKYIFNLLFINTKNNNNFIQFIRYFISSCTALMIDFLLFIILTRVFHINYVVSNVLGNIAGMFVNYFLNILWVFNKRKFKNKKLEFIFFIIIGFLGTLLNTFLIWLLTSFFYIYDLISKSIATIISYIFRYLLRKFLLFR